MHTCLPKPNTKKYRSLVKEAVLRNIDVGTHAVQQAEVGEAVSADDIQEACRRAMHLSYATIRYEKPNLAHVRNPNKQSLDAVGIFKKGFLYR